MGIALPTLPMTIQASIPWDNLAAGVSAMPRRVAAGRIARKRKIVSAEMSLRHAPRSASDGIAGRLADRPSCLLAARARLQLSLDSRAPWTCLALAIDCRNDRSLPAIIRYLSQALFCRRARKRPRCAGPFSLLSWLGLLGLVCAGLGRHIGEARSATCPWLSVLGSV